MRTEDRMNKNVPPFLERFRNLIIDIKEDSQGPIGRTLYYIKGHHHDALKEFGHCLLIERGWSGGLETELEIWFVKAVQIFQVVENVANLENVA